MKADCLIAIGTSAGGVDALRRLFGGLRPDIPAAFCVVMHVPALAESHLPELLTTVSSFPAHHAVAGEPINAGSIYVAPPDWHFVLEDSEAVLQSGPKENRSRPAIDPLFRSVALAYGPRAIGVILTGRLDDGAAGLREIKKHGGATVVQLPEDAAYPEMPASALRSVAVDYQVSLSDMPGLLMTLCTKCAKVHR